MHVSLLGLKNSPVVADNQLALRVVETIPSLLTFCSWSAIVKCEMCLLLGKGEERD
jgi:hypothetical protein